MDIDTPDPNPRLNPVPAVNPKKRSRPPDLDATEFEPPAKKQIITASEPNGHVPQPMDVDEKSPSQRKKRQAAPPVASYLEPILTELLEELRATDTESCFHNPTSKRLFPDYYRVVKNPIDFSTIERKIQNHSYTTLQSFKDDVQLISTNAMQFHEPDTLWYEEAEKLKEFAPQLIESAAQKQGFSLQGGKPKRSKKSRSSSSLSSSATIPRENKSKKSKRSKKGGKSERASESPPREFTEEELEKVGVKTLRVRKNEGYEEIRDYLFVEAKEDPDFSAMLLTSKKGCCDGEHCGSFDELGPFDLIKEQWESKCADRQRQTECSEECKCTEETCKNRNISVMKHKKLGEEVQEQDVYGIDSYTRQQIELILPDALETLMGKDAKWKFIENKILPSINSFETRVKDLPAFASRKSLDASNSLSVSPFYFTDVLRLMLFDAEENGDNMAQQALSHTLRVCLELARMFCERAADDPEDAEQQDFRGQIKIAKNSVNFEEEPWSSAVFLQRANAVSENETDHWLVVGEQAMCDGEFPLYSKGRGVVCLDKNGFQANEFVVNFFGEVYPPWLWHEKTDRVKFLEKNKGYSTERQPDFFNMLLERHKDDEDGYNLVFVDPSRKGNYASRLSHSCRPNCMAVSMAANGRFVVGVYAIREIKFGEELCFDYMSITEDEAEYLKAICLCGTKACRNYYLMYAGTGAFAELMKTHQGFLHRTANMYVASTRKVTTKDRALLGKFHFGKALFHNVPNWIIKYAAKVCEFIEFERERLPVTLWDLSQSDNEKVQYHFDNEDETEIEAAGVLHNRLQTLAISVHRVAFYLNHPNNLPLKEKPPLLPLDAEMLVKKIWTEKESLVASFLKVATPHLGQDHRLIQMLRSKPVPPATPQGVKDMRKTLLEVSKQLREIDPEPVAFHHAAADLFFLYANTKYFFTTLSHRSFSSRKFTFRDLGYTRQGSAPPKSYQAQYAWGQLNFWDRQTIERPDASLSQMRRGTVALPAVASCYRGVNAGPPKRLYNEMQRDEMLEWIETKAAQPWPTKWHWGFKNGKIYGSPWLDTYIDAGEKSKLERVVETMRSWSYEEIIF